MKPRSLQYYRVTGLQFYRETSLHLSVCECDWVNCCVCVLMDVLGITFGLACVCMALRCRSVKFNSIGVFFFVPLCCFCVPLFCWGFFDFNYIRCCCCFGRHDCGVYFWPFVFLCAAGYDSCCRLFCLEVFIWLWINSTRRFYLLWILQFFGRPNSTSFLERLSRGSVEKILRLLMRLWLRSFWVLFNKFCWMFFILIFVMGLSLFLIFHHHDMGVMSLFLLPRAFRVSNNIFVTARSKKKNLWTFLYLVLSIESCL